MGSSDLGLQTPSFDAYDSAITHRLENKKFHELTIYKIDKDSQKPLSGAKFTLQVWDSSKQQFVDVKNSNNSIIYESGTDGKLKLSSKTEFHFLENTAYRLIETTPPIGYLMDENPQIINFYYSEGDESKFINKPEGYKGYNLAIEEHEIPVSNEKYHELKLRKVDSETGQPLDQTEFTLQVWDSVTNKYKDYLKSDNQVLKFYSDKDGEIQISSNRDFKFLKNQAYRLIETGAKDGYILPADPPVIEFFYGGGSEGISKPDNFNGVDLSKEEQTVTIKNVKNRNLSILKVDSEDPAKTIKDTEFTLSKFEKGVYSKVTDGNGNTITFKTNQNGQIQITEYIKDKNFIFSDKVLYILEETKANVRDSIKAPISGDKQINSFL